MGHNVSPFFSLLNSRSFSLWADWFWWSPQSDGCPQQCSKLCRVTTLMALVFITKTSRLIWKTRESMRKKWTVWKSFAWLLLLMLWFLKGKKSKFDYCIKNNINLTDGNAGYSEDKVRVCRTKKPPNIFLNSPNLVPEDLTCNQP